MLLPGETLAFEFIFKADKPGVFTEYWSLCTGPVLCGGRPIYVKLTGIAHTEDAHVQQRNDITVSAECKVQSASSYLCTYSTYAYLHYTYVSMYVRMCKRIHFNAYVRMYIVP